MLQPLAATEAPLPIFAASGKRRHSQVALVASRKQRSAAHHVLERTTLPSRRNCTLGRRHREAQRSTKRETWAKVHRKTRRRRPHRRGSHRRRDRSATFTGESSRARTDPGCLEISNGRCETRSPGWTKTNETPKLIFFDDICYARTPRYLSRARRHSVS